MLTQRLPLPPRTLLGLGHSRARSIGVKRRAVMLAPTLTVMLALALLSACAVGPNFHRPAAPVAAGYTPQPLPDSTTASTAPGGAAEHFVMGRDISFAWWRAFGSDKLDALVQKALANNPTLAAAEAALQQAHEQTAAQRGFFYPTVTPSFSPSRQQIAGNLGGSSDPGPQANGTNLAQASPTQPLAYSFYTAQLALSYTPDVFGGNRRQVESLKAQEQTLRFEREAAYITLSSNVAAAALQEASLRAQIAVTKAMIDSNRQALAILEQQQRAGLVMKLDVAQQQAALAQAEALLPPLAKALAQTQDLIRALVGGLPSDDIAMDFDLDQLTLPAELPLSLPAQLIDQRPDVRAAEEQLHAASAEVGVAARLPQFTITGAYGGAASTVGQLFAAGGPFWNIIGDATAPIFDGGTLAHRQHAAEQGLIAARAQYRSAVLTAFQNVADTLHAIAADAEGLAAAARAEAAARTTRDVTRDQYRAGYVNYQVLLAAEGAYNQAVIIRVQAQTNRYGDAAALFQALGGGWWNRTTPSAMPKF